MRTGPTMRPRRPTVALATLALTLLGASASELAGTIERLRLMPPAQRERLWSRLREFDALPADEQARVRELDRRLAALPVDERRRLLRLIDAYESWLSDQPEPVRARIAAASPDARIALVNDLRARQRQERGRPALRGRLFDDRLQVSSLASEPLMLSALELRLWFSLGTDDREAVLKPPNPKRQKEEFFRRVRDSEHLGPVVRELTGRLRLEEGGRRPRLEEKIGPRIDQFLEEALRQRYRGVKFAPRVETGLRNAAVAVLKRQEEPKADPDQLRRFEEHMPPWVRESLDPLPPDSAERRLRILYRLVFPPGEELPAPAPPKKPEAKAAPPRRPAESPRDF